LWACAIGLQPSDTARIHYWEELVAIWAVWLSVFTVYFRISLKRGQIHRSKLQGGGGQSHIKCRESQFQAGGQKHPVPLPEIYPVSCWNKVPDALVSNLSSPRWVWWMKFIFFPTDRPWLYFVIVRATTYQIGMAEHTHRLKTGLPVMAETIGFHLACVDMKDSDIHVWRWVLWCLNKNTSDQKCVSHSWVHQHPVHPCFLHQWKMHKKVIGFVQIMNDEMIYMYIANLVAVLSELLL
jgi:hypothetical protein